MRGTETDMMVENSRSLAETLMGTNDCIESTVPAALQGAVVVRISMRGVTPVRSEYCRKSSLPAKVCHAFLQVVLESSCLNKLRTKAKGTKPTFAFTCIIQTCHQFRP
jgi:hypothetical protein